MLKQYPVPPHFDVAPDKKLQLCETVWRVPYNTRVNEAKAWALQNGINHSAADKQRITLMLIDNQYTFCSPEFELFVGGANGRGAVEDSVRITDFIYKNLGNITNIVATMDTHYIMQIFHPMFWENDAGENPAPFTVITVDDVETGKWKVNAGIAQSIAKGNWLGLQKHALHYVRTLANSPKHKYPLMIWPYHAMLGGVGHALVAPIDEAIFYHGIARSVQPKIETKGNKVLTENYSVIDPEVKVGANGQPIAQRNSEFLNALLNCDMLIIAGQAKSHCVAWTIDDLLTEINAVDPAMAQRVVLLEDCTTSVTGFEADGDAAFQRFQAANMKLRKSTTPIDQW